MGNRYAEISDITALGRILTNSQLSAVENLLDTASSKLRIIAVKNGTFAGTKKFQLKN